MMGVKAFELSLTVERGKLSASKSKTVNISCMELSASTLYIGSTEGLIIQFALTESPRSGSGNPDIRAEQLLSMQCASRKPIQQIKCASALQRLVIVTDNTLVMLNQDALEIVPTAQKLKNVLTCVLNERPCTEDPFCVEMCVAFRRKAVTIYDVRANRLAALREIPLPDPPLTLAWQDRTICVALSYVYLMVDVDTLKAQELFPYDSDDTRPIVKYVGSDEFVLGGPSGLGIFASSSGSSQRPPLQWTETVCGLAYAHPYVLALDAEYVTVHSVADQRLKQSIPFVGGTLLGDYEGTLLVATQREVYSLTPVPVEAQIERLLAEGAVEEALLLAENCRSAGDRFTATHRQVQLQAGFVRLAESQFLEASTLFASGSLDARELVALYPGLLPANSTFTRTEQLHQLGDINIMAKGNKDVLAGYKEFILSYLVDTRPAQGELRFQDIDTAVVKLYSELEPRDKLIEFIEDKSNRCELEECLEWLERRGCFYAMGVLYATRRHNLRAVEMWEGLVDGRVTDSEVPSLEYIRDFVVASGEELLLWSVCEWLLSRDQELGASLFVSWHTELSKSPDDILEFLHSFPVAKLKYLQFLVFTRCSPDPDHHTHLVMLYLDRVLKLRAARSDPPWEPPDPADRPANQPAGLPVTTATEPPDPADRPANQPAGLPVTTDTEPPDPADRPANQPAGLPVTTDTLSAARAQLLDALQSSELYNVGLIQSRIRDDSGMHREMALLHGRRGDHDLALGVLVHELGDYAAARRYCTERSEPTSRRKLFHSLLELYLRPRTTGPLLQPAIDLLNSGDADFDAVEILTNLPDNWSLSSVSDFLSKSVRNSFHSRCSSAIGCRLSVHLRATLSQTLATAQSTRVTATESSKCDVCSSPLGTPTFARFPNGTITHTKCAKSLTVCPVTGTIFTAAAKTKSN